MKDNVYDFFSPLTKQYDKLMNWTQSARAHFTASNFAMVFLMVLFSAYVIKSFIQFLNVVSFGLIVFKTLNPPTETPYLRFRQAALVLAACAITLGFIIPQQSLVSLAMCAPLAIFLVHDLARPFFSGWPKKEEGQSFLDHSKSIASHFKQTAADGWAFTLMVLPFLHQVALGLFTVLSSTALSATPGFNFLFATASLGFMPYALSALSLAGTSYFLYSEKSEIASQVTSFFPSLTLLKVAFELVHSSHLKETATPKNQAPVGDGAPTPGSVPALG
ncbi:MAG: hypothetical protein VX737_03575 [Pseudomonadota bacterium]|nr:hypothetical protein [Pseudomonadota bacterium]